MVRVVVGCRFHSDGSWSATVRAEDEVLAEHAAVSGRELVLSVGARLARLAERWQRPVRAVYSLGGDARAFRGGRAGGGIQRRGL